MQAFLRSIKLMKLLRLHIHVRFNWTSHWFEVMRWICWGYECRLCMDLHVPETNSVTVRDLYCLWAACPFLSWFTVAMCALSWIVFVPRASHQCCALAVALHQLMWQRAGRNACIKPPEDVRSSWNISMCSFKIYGIWPQADIHTCTYTQLPQMQSR